MATYCNQHWLLSHIRNSFISTDDTGMCETVMVSDDLPKYYLSKYQSSSQLQQQAHAQQRKSSGNNSATKAQIQRVLDAPLQEVDFICYPGLDLSDDEDMDLSSQSYDIQMYPEVGAHRFRSNTAQKLEKMDIARRKAARTKCINYDDDVIPPERNDYFIKKTLPIKKPVETKITANMDAIKVSQEQELSDTGIKSKLSYQLANSPKQSQNKFMEYAKYDGTSQTGIQTKRINVYLSMLPERERNYPIKICVLASAKIIEVIGLVCYKATMQYPDIPLKSIRHYALYMTEDNDDMEDFPPLDNREPCSKFGFSQLTLAERRPLAPVTRIDYHNNLATKSMTSEEDKARLAAAAVHSLQNIELNGGNAAAGAAGDEKDKNKETDSDEHSEHDELVGHNNALEAPMYRTYRLQIIDKPFFKTEVTLGISGDRMEIDQHKIAKFWTKQKAVTYPIESIAFCEIIERRSNKTVLRIWLKSSSSGSSGDGKSIPHQLSGSSVGSGATHSPNSPGHYTQHVSPFTFFHSSAASSQQHHHIRFKHCDFETDFRTATHILNKLNCILEVRSSEVRREFIQLRERKLEKSQAKKQLKM